MKRGVPTWIALVLSVSMLAGCDLSSLMELARPQPPKPGLQMVLQAESGQGWGERDRRAASCDEEAS